MFKNLKEKIYKLLEKQYTVMSLLLWSLRSVIMAYVVKIVSQIYLIVLGFKYNLLISNNIENIEKFHNSPMTQEQIYEIMNKIGNDLQPFYYVYCAYIILTVVFLILASYKFINERKINHV
jgi:hypothetical protein